MNYLWKTKAYPLPAIYIRPAHFAPGDGICLLLYSSWLFYFFNSTVEGKVRENLVLFTISNPAPWLLCPIDVEYPSILAKVI